MKTFIKKHKKVVSIGVVLVIVLVVAVQLLLPNTPLKTLLMSKEAKEGQATLEKVQKRADTDNFHFQINAKPIFENGESEGPIMITNPSDNGYNMQVKIILDDTQEEVYSSEIMVPGNRLSQAKLIKTLGKGTYQATAIFDILDKDTNESIGQVEAAISLTIQS